jgi:hypothetical protein
MFTNEIGKHMHILGRLLVVALLVALAGVLYAFDPSKDLSYLVGTFAPICGMILLFGAKLK